MIGSLLKGVDDCYAFVQTKARMNMTRISVDLPTPDRASLEESRPGLNIYDLRAALKFPAARKTQIVNFTIQTGSP